jgi:hypothetical protein
VTLVCLQGAFSGGPPYSRPVYFTQATRVGLFMLNGLFETQPASLRRFERKVDIHHGWGQKAWRGLRQRPCHSVLVRRSLSPIIQTRVCLP